MLQNLVDAGALLGAGQYGIARVDADNGLDLLANPFGLGCRQIDLIDHRNDFQIVVNRQIGVGEGLGFDTLGSVHHQQGAFAGLQAARNFVGEIDVAGGIDEIQLI